MDETEVRFGDKLFIYGEFITFLEEFSEYEYNAVMGYMTVGGYHPHPIRTDVEGASVPGFVVDFLYSSSLASETPFYEMELVDVTDKLSLDLPLPSGTKVWMPTTDTPLSYYF